MELYDQAIKAYKKATEAKPEQLTAWQGEEDIDLTRFLSLHFANRILFYSGTFKTLLMFRKIIFENLVKSLRVKGISSFYEKKKDLKKEDLEDLAVAYDKILKIFETTDDMKKYYLTSEKLVTLHYEKLGDVQNAIKVIQDRIQVFT